MSSNLASNVEYEVIQIGTNRQDNETFNIFRTRYTMYNLIGTLLTINILYVDKRHVPNVGYDITNVGKTLYYENCFSMHLYQINVR